MLDVVFSVCVARAFIGSVNHSYNDDVSHA